jgi:hypothetical protein
MTPTVDHHQLAALRRLRAAFGEVQVLAVHRSDVEGEPAGWQRASRQLALAIQAPPAPVAGAIPQRRAGLSCPTRHEPVRLP